MRLFLEFQGSVIYDARSTTMDMEWLIMFVWCGKQRFLSRLSLLSWVFRYCVVLSVWLVIQFDLESLMIARMK